MTRREYHIVCAAVSTLWLGITWAAYIALGR
jgi:uncharacterized protein YsxB (DUF464 family)